MAEPPSSVLMVAAENDALRKVDGRGGKVGGIGDVVRDVPPALAALGLQVTVVTPSYGCLHRVANSQLIGHFAVTPEATASAYEVPGRSHHPGVRYLLIDHPNLVSRDDTGAYHIFWDDPPESPFAADAVKFAFFCQAVAAALGSGVIDRPACLHLHDWHASFLLLLREFDGAFSFLKSIKTVYTIHNLGLQGLRPLAHDRSSLESWYPDLDYDVEKVRDHEHTECVNPMRVGIQLADTVHVVSPTYAKEILKPSDPGKGYFGGEGLETDLQEVAASKQLVGILNGLDYDAQESGKRLSWSDLAANLERQLRIWEAKSPPPEVSSRHVLAREHLRQLSSRAEPPAVILTSVTRVTAQKVLIMCQDSPSALDEVLVRLHERNGVYILLGTGEASYEELLAEVATRNGNFLFVNGYSDRCARDLYANGDLFLMPSSYEPCGISQMLAMREGQPCVVHAVGGLADTVDDGVDGFLFSGDDLLAKAAAFVDRCEEALELRLGSPDEWKRICERAAKKRFLWKTSAEKYIGELYSP